MNVIGIKKSENKLIKLNNTSDIDEIVTTYQKYMDDMKKTYQYNLQKHENS